MSVQVDRRPRFGETVTVRTWPRGGEKLFALRDYDIRDAGDEPAVRARSGWIILDMEKRRPLRPQPIMDSLPQNGGLDALSAAVNLAERPGLQKTTERPALYGDVDYNGHVNNVSYIRWIEDSLDGGLLERAGRMRLDINYLNEILPGEVTGIWSARVEDPAETPAGAFDAFAFEGRKIGDRGLGTGDRGSGGTVPTAFRAELRLWQ
jgi:acyl-ACP thioesterase